MRIKEGPFIEYTEVIDIKNRNLNRAVVKQVGSLIRGVIRRNELRHMQGNEKSGVNGKYYNLQNLEEVIYQMIG